MTEDEKDALILKLKRALNHAYCDFILLKKPVLAAETRRRVTDEGVSASHAWVKIHMKHPEDAEIFPLGEKQHLPDGPLAPTPPLADQPFARK